MQRNILIVDDQTDILRILEREFRRRGDYSVTTAICPADALEVMERAPVELIISDLRLGKQTGFSLLQEVNQRHPGVGTILMTAYRSPAYRQQAEALGVCSFLEKPFPVATLVTAVDRFFQQRAAAQSETRKISDSGEINTLTHFKPQDLVQLFCLNGRNVRIAINTDPEKSPGYIYIQRGRVLHAEFGEQTSEGAFHTLMKEPHSNLSLQDWDDPVKQTIQTAWEHLLLESACQLDMSNEDVTETIVDSFAQPAKVAPPLPEPLTDPFADFWKVAHLSDSK